MITNVSPHDPCVELQDGFELVVVDFGVQLFVVIYSRVPIVSMEQQTCMFPDIGERLKCRVQRHTIVSAAPCELSGASVV